MGTNVSTNVSTFNQQITNINNIIQQSMIDNNVVVQASVIQNVHAGTMIGTNVSQTVTISATMMAVMNNNNQISFTTDQQNTVMGNLKTAFQGGLGVNIDTTVDKKSIFTTNENNTTFTSGIQQSVAASVAAIQNVNATTMIDVNISQDVSMQILSNAFLTNMTSEGNQISQDLIAKFQQQSTASGFDPTIIIVVVFIVVGGLLYIFRDQIKALFIAA